MRRRNPSPTLTFLVGLTCVGKSHYLKSHNIDAVVLSTDNIIEAIARQEGITYDEFFNTMGAVAPNRFVAQVLPKLNQQIDYATSNNLDVVVDMQNIDVRSRALTYDNPKFANYRRIAVVFDDDQLSAQNPRYLEAVKVACAERGIEQDKTIPEHVIERSFNGYQRPTSSEGFEEIIDVQSSNPIIRGTLMRRNTNAGSNLERLKEELRRAEESYEYFSQKGAAAFGDDNPAEGMRVSLQLARKIERLTDEIARLEAQGYRSNPLHLNPAMRRNVSDQRKALRDKYRAKHGNDWWQDESIKAKFEAELKKTPKGGFTRGGERIAREVDESKSRSRVKKRKEKVVKKEFYSESFYDKVDIAIQEKLAPIVDKGVSEMDAIDAEEVGWSVGDFATLELSDNKDIWFLQMKSDKKRGKKGIEAVSQSIDYNATPTKIANEAVKLYKRFIDKYGEKKSSSRKSSSKSRSASRARAVKADFKVAKSGKSYMWELIIGGDIATKSGYKTKASAKAAFLKAIAQHEKLIEDRGVDTFDLYCNVRDL